MHVAGIVAEYNPFHSGHRYQIRQTRQLLGEDCPVVAVMSGNWVQSGAPAAADKWLRARMALMGGVDLVLELPTPWALSSAEAFAGGAVWLLHAAGVVTHLSFGSEGGQVEPLAQAARCLDDPAFPALLGQALADGSSFAAGRQRAAEQLAGPEVGALLSAPNNNLGVEYLRALRRWDSRIQPITVRRVGAGHNHFCSHRPEHLSATQIRSLLLEDDWQNCAPYLEPQAAALLRSAPRITQDSLALAQRLILARLRGMDEEVWARLPDVGAGEGLNRRLARAGRQAASLEEFYTLAKTKRYAHARLRRLALWAYLGLDENSRPQHPPYLRVLGCTSRGQELLARMRKEASLPVLTKPAHVRRLESQAQTIFQQETRCTDLYDLLLAPLLPGGREWRTRPERWEGGPTP